MHSLDLFIKRELSCKGYLRYVDDFALFSNSKKELWLRIKAVIERLETMRLRIHKESAQVVSCSSGIPWLGFVIYPTYRRLKSREVIHASKRLNDRFNAW